MTTSSQNEMTGEVEDIFSDVAASPIQAPTVTTDYSTLPGPVTATPRRFTLPMPSRRTLWIAIAVATLLLLVASVIAVVIWLQSGSSPNTNTVTVNSNSGATIIPNTNSVTPINQPVDTTPQFIDADHDGLSDEEEVIANTNPKKQDTDDDGLSDREEVRVYNTDPRNPDTDSDGYNDGDEVANFYHPNSPDPKQRLFDLPN